MFIYFTLATDGKTYGHIIESKNPKEIADILTNILASAPAIFATRASARSMTVSAEASVKMATLTSANKNSSDNAMAQQVLSRMTLTGTSATKAKDVDNNYLTPTLLSPSATQEYSPLSPAQISLTHARTIRTPNPLYHSDVISNNVPTTHMPNPLYHS